MRKKYIIMSRYFCNITIVLTWIYTVFSPQTNIFWCPKYAMYTKMYDMHNMKFCKFSLRICKCQALVEVKVMKFYMGLHLSECYPFLTIILCFSCILYVFFEFMKNEVYQFHFCLISNFFLKSGYFLKIGYRKVSGKLTKRFWWTSILRNLKVKSKSWACRVYWH